MGRRRILRGEVPARITTRRVMLEDGRLYVVETDHAHGAEVKVAVDAFRWVADKEVPGDLKMLDGREAYTAAGGWIAFVDEEWPVRLETRKAVRP